MIFLETLDFSVQKPFIFRGVALYQHQLAPLTVASVGISVHKKFLGWPSYDIKSLKMASKGGV